MFRSFLSWRYLFARRTNLIGIVGILVAVGALILILSIMTGFLEETRRAVRGSLADVLIQPYGLGPTAGSADSVAPLLAAVSEDERVRGSAAQLVWGGIVGQRGANFERYFSNSQTSRNPCVVQIVGVDVAGHLRLSWPTLRVAASPFGIHLPQPGFHDELQATDLLAALVGKEGKRRPVAPVANPFLPFLPPAGYRPEGRPKAGLVVGDQLIRVLDLRVGETLQLATVVMDPETGDPGFNNRDFVITGSFRTGENETDLTRVYLDRRELSDFLGGTREFTQVLLQLEDYERDSQELVTDLRASLTDRGLIVGTAGGRSEVRTWEGFRGNLLGAIENERVLMAIMLSLVLVVAGFTIFAILSMMVTEKRRDIGILLALGATPRGILDLFLFIACWDALVGAILGGVLGTWGALKIDPIERALSSSLGIEIFNRDVYLFDHIPSIVQPVAVALIVLGAFVCALVFAAVPAWRAARLDPLEALRYE